MDIKNGSQFEQYTFVRKLGEGGMGVVYLAHDPRLKRDVALKLLPYTLSQDTGFRARFEREAKTVAQLEHPAIIPLYGYGEIDGQPYLTMRFMRGGTLANRLERGPLSLDETNRILQRICGALDKAHENKIIHRDLKPANILFDEDGRAYLGDFGIARIAEGSQTMTIVGTPQYMAPEQAHGHALDACTDIYQMGVVLFQMLTGSVPFEASAATALLYQHAYAPIPSAEDMNASLPTGCDQIISKAMAKEREQRFRTAGELAASFAIVVANEPGLPNNGHASTIIEESAIANSALRGDGDLGIEQGLKPGSSSQLRMPRWWWAGGIILLVFGILGGFSYWKLRGDNQSAVEPSKTAVPVIAAITETALIAATSQTPTDTAVPFQTATLEGGAVSFPDPPSPLPSKTATPTRFPTETPEPELLSLLVPIDSIANASVDYADLPLGEVELSNIPFVLSSRIFKSQAGVESARTLPVNAIIPMDIERAQRIHLLLVAGNGFDRFAGAAIGRIEVQCNDSREIVAELELGRNIREWHFAEDVVSYASDTNEVWRGPIIGFPNAIGYVDMLSIDLPAACQEGRLTAIEILDLSLENIQSLDPAINLIALTVDHFQ